MSKVITYSPLRYPGGKSALSNFIADTLCLNDINGGSYFEPYAGGAAIGLSLLIEGLVERIYINDLDKCVYCFWHSVIKENKRFIEAVMNSELNIEEWKYYKNIYRNHKKFSVFEVGYASFYLNRCNRSGIMKDAGPIGGYNQTGKWKIGARFNKVHLAERIRLIGKYKDRINVSCLDGIVFLSKMLPQGHKRRKVLVYLDPPYFAKGPELYMNSYHISDHSRLSRYLKRQKTLPWIMTYDNASEIRALYGYSTQNPYGLNYSAQDKKKGQEILISPNYLKLPTSLTIHKKRFDLRSN